jgi:hypothetical protein
LSNLFKKETYKHFSKSHSTLLIFRKFLDGPKRYLELRHQRSGDAVFDYTQEGNYKPFYYIYKLIEILLPKANYQHNKPLKLMEMYYLFDFSYARKGLQRKGWIHVVQK